MSIQSLIKRNGATLVAVCLGILLVVQLTGAVDAVGVSAENKSSAGSVSLQSEPEAVSAIWYTCNPDSVASYTTRVHVKCDIPYDGIEYFAAPTSNSKHAARVLSVLLTAQATGTQVSVLFDPEDTSGPDFGCLAADCKPLLAVAAE